MGCFANTLGKGEHMKGLYLAIIVIVSITKTTGTVIAMGVAIDALAVAAQHLVVIVATAKTTTTTVITFGVAAAATEAALATVAIEEEEEGTTGTKHFICRAVRLPGQYLRHKKVTSDPESIFDLY